MQAGHILRFAADAGNGVPGPTGWIAFCEIAAAIAEIGNADDAIPLNLKRKESYGSANPDAVAT